MAARLALLDADTQTRCGDWGSEDVMTGSIITFYSYKGGVGRTFALANVAVLFAQWGRRVLCIDWDLEAPGLHLYFERWIRPREHPGLVEVVNAWSEDADVDWTAHVTPVPIPELAGTLHVMTAGRIDDGYVARMQRIDWTSLYERSKFADRIEAMRDAWREQYDVILVDSRTGVTDIGGICTIQIPDVLVLLYTANDQSVEGVRDVAERVARARQKLPYDRAAVPCVPVATRFDGRVEGDLARAWLMQFAERLGDLYCGWCHRDVQPRALLDFVRIPYVAYWSFGEKLPVLDEGTRAPESVGFAFETLAALLAHGLANTDVLLQSRDVFVARARQGLTSKSGRSDETLAVGDEFSASIRAHRGSQEKITRSAATVALVDELSVPVRTRRDVKAVCGLQFELNGRDLEALWLDLSVARGGRVVDQIEGDIRDAQRGMYRTVLLSGHVGSGKTTELRWLTKQLETEKDGRRFHVLWVDALEYLDINSLQLPEFLVAIFSAIVDDPLLQPMVGISATAKKLWRGIREWLKPIGIELEAEIPKGVAKLKAKVKTEFDLQKRMRETLRERVTELMIDLSDLLTDLRSGLAKQGIDDIVIVADNLEKIVLAELDHQGTTNTHDVFFVEQLPLVQHLRAHTLLTVPVSLYFTFARLRQVFLDPTVKVLPIVPVHLPGDPRKPDVLGMEALKKLLRVRVDTAILFADDEAFTLAVELSGGVIRDLFRVVLESLSLKPAMGLTVADIESGVKDIVSSYERVLQGTGYLPQLHEIAMHGRIPVGLDETTRNALLYNTIVLEYNGDTWYDVHPLARRTRAYQNAAPTGT